MFGGNFAPSGWMFCNGQLLPISDYDSLFNLIGTSYGGDGQQTFQLPNLQGRVPMHLGSNGVTTYSQAQTGGLESITLTVNQIPQHSHTPVGRSEDGSKNSPSGNVWASSGLDQFSSGSPATAMASQAIQLTGGSQPHDNMIPFLCVNFIISLFGVYPTAT
jgi:microcystin-dependent protein